MEAYFRVEYLLGCEYIAVRMFIQPLEVVRLSIFELQCRQAVLIGAADRMQNQLGASMLLCESYD